MAHVVDCGYDVTGPIYMLQMVFHKGQDVIWLFI